MIYAIDISSKMIDIARSKSSQRKIQNINYTYTSIFDERFEGDSFDVIIVYNVLHLLEDSQEVIQRINDLLKPDGYIIAAVLNIIGFICLLLVLSLSQQFVKAGMPDSTYFQILGDLLRSGRDFVNHVAMILATGVAGLMFYILLYQTRLIPRWLSFWGLSGTIFTISASLLIMFQIINIITTIYIVLNLPLILLEIVLAIWFIAKGVDSNVMNSIIGKR
jgi:SAM-dependent methyltransferase